MRAMLLIYGLATALAAVLQATLWPLIKALARVARWCWRRAQLGHLRLRAAELEAAIDAARQQQTEIAAGLPHWEAELRALRHELQCLQAAQKAATGPTTRER